MQQGVGNIFLQSEASMVTTVPNYVLKDLARENL